MGLVWDAAVLIGKAKYQRHGQKQLTAYSAFGLLVACDIQGLMMMSKAKHAFFRMTPVNRESSLRPNNQPLANYSDVGRGR